jgi:hypothetical protein
MISFPGFSFLQFQSRNLHKQGHCALSSSVLIPDTPRQWNRPRRIQACDQGATDPVDDFLENCDNTGW